MLETLDTVISYVVIMTLVSLVITLLVQMASATLSLRGKNLANALSLTFQTIEPKLGELAHSLAAHILRDPIFSDSLFAPKTRPAAPVISDPKLLALIDAQRQLMWTHDELALDPSESSRQSAVAATARVAQAKGEVSPEVIPSPLTLVPHTSWGFFNGTGSLTLTTAIRPGEIYRLLHELGDLTAVEAELRGIPSVLAEKSRELLRALNQPDQPAAESKEKLQEIARVADLFGVPGQKEAVVQSLTNFGSTVERATTMPYDRFQRWFGSAQDRAEQWFQMHMRVLTIGFAFAVALTFELDTVDIYRQLRNQPAIVAALTQAAPAVIVQGQSVDNAKSIGDNLQRVSEIKTQLDNAGFDLLPSGFLERWGCPRLRNFFGHFIGMLISAGLLTLGAPFWFNLLKNLVNLRPAVATLIERRPQSAPALPAAPSSPSPAS